MGPSKWKRFPDNVSDLGSSVLTLRSRVLLAEDLGRSSALFGEEHFHIPDILTCRRLDSDSDVDIGR